MKDTPLLSVTKIIDDESGICSGDLCDFSIHCADLDDFLRSHGQKGAEEICETLDYLKKAVMEEYLPKAQKESGSKMKIKISKSQWEEMGKKAGWMKKAVHQDELLKNEIMSYPPHLIIKAIKALGEVSIAGFSGITETDLQDIFLMCDDYELSEILSAIKKQVPQKQPELNFAKDKTHKKV